MKRIILVLLVFLFGINICLASNTSGSSYSNFYRTNFPIKVYVPNHSKSFLIKKAFTDWNTKTNGKVQVEYVSEQRKNASTLRFEFVDTFGDSRLGYTTNYSSGNVIRYSTIQLSLIDNNSKKPLSNQSIYYITVHEIGHAFGLQHSGKVESIMYPNFNPYIQQSLLNEDITAFKKMYRF